VPDATPMTTPDVPTVAIAALLLIQVPPLVASVKVIVAPEHTVVGPEMAATVGVAVRVIECVAIAVPQLLVTEYDITTEPPVTPVTTPPVLTVAMAFEELIQVPPPAELVRLIVAPVHKVEEPVSVPALGLGLTVTTVVAATVPQLLLTV